jgi:transcriptional regulator PpsR
VKQFKAAKDSLGNLDAEAAATLIAAATDVAIILDGQGVIRDLAFDSNELALEGYETWLGKPWIDTVTIESRPKVEALLRDAAARSAPRWRQLNHPSARGPDLPVLYSAVQVGADGRVVVVGRDLRAIASLQQRLVDAQQSVERDYARLRHVETRYRLLFQMSSDAVLIVDAASHKVIEANRSSGELLGESVRQIVGRPFPQGFDVRSTEAVRALLAAIRATGKADDVRARLAGGEREFLVSASLFRQDNASLFLVRLTPLQGGSAAIVLPPARSVLLRLVESAPDGFVVTGPDGRIIAANAAFLDLVQLGREEQVRGESLDRWLGRPGVDLNVLVANLRQHGTVRLFATTLAGEHGAAAEVEISAVTLLGGEAPSLGFAIRNVGRRLGADGRGRRDLPRSVDQLTELVGRVPLKELVRETTDVIERMCIEAALELTGDNRASAAEMLGLSRQSLYVKLRRYGLGDLAAADGDK